MKIYVLYHANCADGFGAALCAWLKFGADAEYIPVSYGQPVPPLELMAAVYIVDFSFPRGVLAELRVRTSTLVILDHHETARKELEGFPGAVFDMTKSGARLAWEYFHPNEPVPALIRYIEDRDLWKWELPDSREVSAALGTYEQDLAMWGGMLAHGEEEIERLAGEGEAILRLVRQNVERQCWNVRVAGFRLINREVKFQSMPAGQGFYPVDGEVKWAPVVNATCHVSEVGEHLLQKFPSAPFVAVYLDKADGSRMWSLRSRKDFDCSPIAKAFGGGGHKQACGFTQVAPGGDHEGGGK